MIEFMPPLALFSTELDPLQLPAIEVEGLYIHVPFCVHKCHYCDFYSIAHQSAQRMSRFVDLVLREAELWAGLSRGPKIRPRTVFFGGGTPSLLPIEEMEKLLAGLRKTFDFSVCNEWTLEANPSTIGADYCRMLREHGVDRISFGAQSFDRAELSILERHHDPEDVPKSVQWAREGGIRRLNVDLIYALPGQNMERWMRSLKRAIELGTDHLSCYGLTYEPNTPMAVRLRLGQFQAAEPELELEMMHATRQRLGEIGMSAYEISNYSRPGEECRHNLMYWNGGNYLGLGPAAASHVSGWRWRNRPHLGEWESAVDSGDLAAAEVEHLSKRKRAGELAMLQLRLARGLNYSDFSARTGQDACVIFAEVIDRLRPSGLLQTGEAGIQLSDQGLAVADAIAAEFLAAAGE
jgi:oxygen-independent coproporphyrinogen III oxidase